jgi:hypothetical protein
MAQHFLACVRGSEAPRTDLDSGLRVVRTLEAASESLMRRGVTVELPSLGGLLRHAGSCGKPWPP